jgi:hypothetical protein
VFPASAGMIRSTGLSGRASWSTPRTKCSSLPKSHPSSARHQNRARTALTPPHRKDQMDQQTYLVPRATVSEICRNRDETLRLFGEVHQALHIADEKIRSALAAAALAAPDMESSYSYHTEKEDRAFLGRIKIPQLDRYMGEARKLIDRAVWARIMEMSNLESLMDKKAKDQLRDSLIKDPPEATEDNIRATMESMMGQADMLFRRGIAECFSNLDRRFKSHDGWKIGSRVILFGAISEYGHWSYYRNHQDTIADIERVFMILDGSDAPVSYCGLAAKIQSASPRGACRWTGYVETEYFRVRVFLNGNVHIWFQRPDLVLKVNQLLGEYYDAPIPEERTPDDKGGLNDPKTAVARNFAFYPTPEPAVNFVFGDASLYHRPDEPPLRVLEPSAGTGNIARLAVEKGAVVDCIEIQPQLAHELRQSGLYRSVLNTDFLAVQPDPDNLYDKIWMNPPFDMERDIDHVLHALKFLKDDGELTAIMSAGTEFRDTRKAIAFRKLMEEMNADLRDLPPASFASVGTYCNTIAVIVRKSTDGYRWRYGNSKSMTPP